MSSKFARLAWTQQPANIIRLDLRGGQAGRGATLWTHAVKRAQLDIEALRGGALAWAQAHGVAIANPDELPYWTTQTEETRIVAVRLSLAAIKRLAQLGDGDVARGIMTLLGGRL